MTINELLAAAGLTGDDVIPMYDAEAAAGTEPTQKIKASDFVAAMKTLGSLLSQSDVVNNLTSGSTNPVSSGCVYDNVIDGKTYTGDDSLTVIRVGRLAQMSIFPQTSTTAQSAVVGTITDEKFRPVTDIDLYTSVYNGGTYVNCWLQISSTSGDISIKSTSGSVVAGYQAKYCKAKGLTWICPGT